MDRVALVSGGTYGIGRAVTLRLAADGYQVAAIGIDTAQAAGLQQEFRRRGRDGLVLHADVSRTEQVELAVGTVLSEYGRLDVLVNVAGVAAPGSILDTAEEVWDRVFEVNVRGLFLVTKAVLPGMIANRSGAIVNIGSGAGYGRHGPRPGFAYCVSKGAVFPFTNALALEYARDGIRVNAVIPGGTYPVAGNETLDPSVPSAYANNVAGRMNHPDEVASAVAWLASSEAQTISGAVLEVGTLPRWPAGAPDRHRDGPMERDAAGRDYLGPPSYRGTPENP